MLWDEAHDNPALLRFLAPFGRPDLRRIERCFRGAPEVADVVSERYPVFATWRSTMLLRAGQGTPTNRTSFSPRREVLEASMALSEDLSIGQARHRRNVRCKVLSADGCVLIGGRVDADFVSAPATQLSQPGGRLLGRALCFQVATAVKCRVFDTRASGWSAPSRPRSSRALSASPPHPRRRRD